MNAITRAERAQFEAPTVTFTLNGREVTGLSTETILEIADHEGIEIPRLCYKAGLDAVGNCRSCMVEIKGERVLAASCCRTAQAGMQVTTDSARAQIPADGDRTAAVGHAGEGIHTPHRGR